MAAEEEDQKRRGRQCVVGWLADPPLMLACCHDGRSVTDGLTHSPGRSRRSGCRG